LNAWGSLDGEDERNLRTEGPGVSLALDSLADLLVFRYPFQHDLAGRGGERTGLAETANKAQEEAANQWPFSRRTIRNCGTPRV
jgi:hypothetical protein